MTDTPNIRFDVASVLNRGCRDYQEDAIATDFPLGAGFGYAVLSDGMGGHAAGDVASKIVVTEVFSELKFQSSDPEALTESVGEILKSAAASANDCMAAHTANNPHTQGMGATLVAPVIIGDSLYWISIGDSPLYLLRDGRLRQLNEDHSLGPHIDYMVRSGMMSEDVGRNHPDRNALTSVLIGETIDRIDCPDRPFRLRDGDLLIVASDGLQFLSNSQITSIVLDHLNDGSATIAETLLDELRALDDPEQDNVCFSVIKVIIEDSENDSGNIFTPEFEPRPRRRAVQTRPIRPVASPDAAFGDEESEQDEELIANGMNGGDHAEIDETSLAKPTSKASRDDEDETDEEDDIASTAPSAAREATPIFLRRRWLATDSGA